MAVLDSARAKWQNIRQQRQVNFDQAFWGDVGRYVNSDLGGYNPNTKQIVFPEATMPNNTVLWNKYNELAKRNGVNASYANFMQAYDSLKLEEDKKYLNVLNQANMLGAKNSAIQKAVLANPEANARINRLFGQLPSDSQAQIAGYLKPKMSLTDFVSENPITSVLGGLGATAGAGYLASRAYQGAKGAFKPKKLKAVGKKPVKKNYKAPGYITQSKLLYEDITRKKTAKELAKDYATYKKSYKGDPKKMLSVVQFAKENRNISVNQIIPQANFNNYMKSEWEKFKKTKGKNAGSFTDWKKGKTVSTMLEGKSAKEIAEIASDKYAPKGKVGNVGQKEIDQKKLDKKFKEDMKKWEAKQPKKFSAKYPGLAKAGRWGQGAITALYLLDMARNMYGSEE